MLPSAADRSAARGLHQVRRQRESRKQGVAAGGLAVAPLQQRGGHLNGMQNSEVQQHFTMHQQRQRAPVIGTDSDSDSAPTAQSAPQVQTRAARQQPSPFRVNSIPLLRAQGTPAAVRAPGSLGRAAGTAGPWETSRCSTSSEVTLNLPDNREESKKKRDGRNPGCER